MLAVDKSPIVRSPALNVDAVAIGLPELLANELRLYRFASPCRPEAWPWPARRWCDGAGQAADCEDEVDTAEPRRRGSNPPGGRWDGPEDDAVDWRDQSVDCASQSPKSVLCADGRRAVGKARGGRSESEEGAVGGAEAGGAGGGPLGSRGPESGWAPGGESWLAGAMPRAGLVGGGGGDSW